MQLIDLSRIYEHVLLCEESKILTTINTYGGLLYYNHLPFGIAIGTLKFQKIITVLQGIPGVTCFQDDILKNS